MAAAKEVPVAAGEAACRAGSAAEAAMMVKWKVLPAPGWLTTQIRLGPTMARPVVRSRGPRWPPPPGRGGGEGGGGVWKSAAGPGVAPPQTRAPHHRAQPLADTQA